MTIGDHSECPVELLPCPEHLNESLPDASPEHLPPTPHSSV
jgi:hypothetical protein